MPNGWTPEESERLRRLHTACQDKAPGKDNGMYDVLCWLPRGHKDRHSDGAGATWRNYGKE